MAARSAQLNLVDWLGRVLLGGAFAWAAVAKILDPQTFATDIDHFRLLPYPVTLAAAIYLPWVEFACGLAVLVRRRERGAQLVLAGLCGLFAVALASAWFRGLDVNCGCFGHGAAATNLPLALARDLGLGILAVLLLRRS